MIARPGNGHDRPRHHLPGRVEARQPLRAAQRDDRHLRWVDDRRRVGTAQHADIGDADGAVGEIRLADPALAGGLGQPRHLAGDLEQAQLLDALDIGHQQADPAVHRHADVAVRLVVDFADRVVDPAVEDRMGLERQRQRLHHQRHQRESRAGRLGLRLEPLTQRQQLGDIDLVAVAEMRDRRRRLDHALGHHRAHAANRLDPQCIRAGFGRVLRRRRRALADAALLEGQHILLEHPAMLAGAGNRGQRDPEFAHQPSHRGARRNAPMRTGAGFGQSPSAERARHQPRPRPGAPARSPPARSATRRPAQSGPLLILRLPRPPRRRRPAPAACRRTAANAPGHSPAADSRAASPAPPRGR